MTIIDQDANPERESLIGQTSGSSKRPLQPSRMRARGQAELLLMAPRRRRIYRFTSRVCFSRHQAPPRLPWSGVRGLWSVLVPCLSPLASRLSPLASRPAPPASCLPYGVIVSQGTPGQYQGNSFHSRPPPPPPFHPVHSFLCKNGHSKSPVAPSTHICSTHMPPVNLDPFSGHRRVTLAESQFSVA